MKTKKGILVTAILLAALSLSTMAWAVDCPIPDTGQTKCYDDTQEITCPQEGEDFYGQDAQYLTNPQSYTTLGGVTMVQDNVTGLIWEVKTDDGFIGEVEIDDDYIHDSSNKYIWQDTQDVFIATLNNDNFGGYSDWRLPTIKELTLIIHRGSYEPTINTVYFPNTESSGYWSSTTYAYVTAEAWEVDFNNGHMGSSSKLGGIHVRAVRGTELSTMIDRVPVPK